MVFHIEKCHDLVVPKTKMTFKILSAEGKANEFHAFDILLDPSQKRTLKTKSSSMLPIIGGIVCFVIGLTTLFLRFLVLKTISPNFN